MPEAEIETDRYGNEIIDMNGPLEPKPSHADAPPYEPDSFVPEHAPDERHPPPEHDFEIGD